MNVMSYGNVKSWDWLNCEIWSIRCRTHTYRANIVVRIKWMVFCSFVRWIMFPQRTTSTDKFLTEQHWESGPDRRLRPLASFRLPNLCYPLPQSSPASSLRALVLPMVATEQFQWMEMHEPLRTKCGTLGNKNTWVLLDLHLKSGELKGHSGTSHVSSNLSVPACSEQTPIFVRMPRIQQACMHDVEYLHSCISNQSYYVDISITNDVTANPSLRYCIIATLSLAQIGYEKTGRRSCCQVRPRRQSSAFCLWLSFSWNDPTHVFPARPTFVN